MMKRHRPGPNGELRGGLDILPVIREKLRELNHQQLNEITTTTKGIIMELKSNASTQTSATMAAAQTPVEASGAQASPTFKAAVQNTAHTMTMEERRTMEAEARMAKDSAVQRAANAFTLLAASTVVAVIGVMIVNGVRVYMADGGQEGLGGLESHQ